MSLKDRISSPLEAGPSILDAHQLPPRVVPAFHHASSCLARRGLHITLVVVRRDYQLPSVGASSVGPPTPATSPRVRTPLSPSFSVSSPRTSRFNLSTLRKLVRTKSLHDSAVPSNQDPVRRGTWSRSGVSPPLTPSTPMSVPPMTPSASMTSGSTEGESVDAFGLRLVHDGAISAREEKVLQAALAKAERAFDLGSEYGSALHPEACGFSQELIQRSILGHDVLFDGQGLKLVSLDRLYSLRAALSSYTRTQSMLRLEDAVDELRRFVLANHRRKVAKADLLRAHDWLDVSEGALCDVERMYRRAYGGAAQSGGIAGMEGWQAVEPVIRDAEDDSTDELEDPCSESWQAGASVTVAAIAATAATPALSVTKRASPKPPALRIQTSFLAKPKAIRVEKHDPTGGRPEGTDDDDEEHTARPADDLPIMLRPWGGSIDQVLSAEVTSPRRGSMRMGPVTPNGYDDISPVTRGEWGFLTTDQAFLTKTAKVETC